MRISKDNFAVPFGVVYVPLSRPGRTVIIFAVIIAVHIATVFGPLLWFVLEAKFFPPKKETAFKVKLGDNTPSVGPVVGPPERLRPSPEPPVSVPPAPAPEPALPPSPEPPVSKPVPPPKPKPKPKAKPKPRPKPKAKPKTVPKPKAKPAKRSKSRTKPQNRNPRHQNANRRPKNIEEAQQGVYRPGGRNTNRNVPIGNRDAAQVYGKKPDYGTPQGGLTANEQAYQKKLGMFLKNRWTPPSKLLLKDTLPSTTIEIAIAADGRVLSAKIIKPSGNREMDMSVARMITQLDRMPVPVNGRNTVIQFEMRPEEE